MTIIKILNINETLKSYKDYSNYLVSAYYTKFGFIIEYCDELK